MNVAIDYYLSGIKLEPSHYGCAYNIGYCYYMTNKFASAEKWFSLAVKLQYPTRHDSLLNQTMAQIKLGEYHRAYQTICSIDKEQLKYSMLQVDFLKIICRKLTK